MRKVSQILFYLGLFFLIVGMASILASLTLENLGFLAVADILGIIGAICGPITLALLIIRLVFFQIRMEPVRKEVYKSKTVAPKEEKVVVEVKEAPKTREQELYEQYENLYNQNLIDKEDLEKKRIELLGK